MSPFSRGSQQHLCGHSVRSRLLQRTFLLYLPSSSSLLKTNQPNWCKFQQSNHLETHYTTGKTSIHPSSAKGQGLRQTVSERRDNSFTKRKLPERIKSSPPISQYGNKPSELPSDIFNRYFKDVDAPVLLYVGPTSNVYKLSCYALSGTCIGIALWTFYDSFLGAPPGLWWPIPYVFLVVTGVAGFIGIYVGRHGARHLQAIHAVPTQRQNAREVMLRMQVKSVLPFWRGKVFDRSPEQVSIARRIATVNKSPLAREADMCRATTDKSRRPILKYGSRILWGEGFAKFWTEENKNEDPWKLDLVNGHWADGGHIIDRLVELRDDPATEQEDMLVVQSSKL